MLVSRISPAPRSTASRAHSTRRGRWACARRPRRPPIERRSPGDAALASIASTTHCAPNTPASSSISSGRCSAAELTDTLSAPASSTAWASATERMPPPIVNGTNTSSAVAARELGDRLAPLVRGRDVEEHELVGALAVVVRGQLHRVAGVADVEEFDALDDAAAVHVQAGDHALEVHVPTVAIGPPRRLSCRTPSACKRFGDGEAPLVQRLADDHPVESVQLQLAAQARESFEVVERADAARDRSRCPPPPPAPPTRLPRDWGRRASRRDRRSCTRSSRTPRSRSRERVAGLHVGRLVQPPCVDHVPAAHVHGDEHALRAMRRRGTLAAGRGSVKAAVPRITRSAPAAQASLDRLRASAGRRRTAPARPACRDPSQVLEVHRRSRLRAVEIDDVQEARAGLDPAARGRQRVLVVDLLGLEIALNEPHGVAAEHVDRRIQLHRRASGRRAAVRRRCARSWPAGAGPAAEDFSG